MWKWARPQLLPQNPTAHASLVIEQKAQVRPPLFFLKKTMPIIPTKALEPHLLPRQYHIHVHYQLGCTAPNTLLEFGCVSQTCFFSFSYSANSDLKRVRWGSSFVGESGTPQFFIRTQFSHHFNSVLPPRRPHVGGLFAR